MNPQNFIIAGELLAKAIKFLSAIHNENHPKSFHDAVSNVIQDIQKNAQPHIPEPEKIVKEGEDNAS